LSTPVQLGQTSSPPEKATSDQALYIAFEYMEDFNPAGLEISG
jgi:hypothetical protein